MSYKVRCLTFEPDMSQGKRHDKTGKVQSGEYIEVPPDECTLVTVEHVDSSGGTMVIADFTGPNRFKDAYLFVDALNKEEVLGKEILRTNGYLLGTCYTIEDIKHVAEQKMVDDVLTESDYWEIGSTLDEMDGTEGINYASIDFAVERYVEENYPEKEWGMLYEITVQGLCSWNARSLGIAKEKVKDDIKVNRDIYLESTITDITIKPD